MKLNSIALIFLLLVGCSVHAADEYSTRIGVTGSSAIGNVGTTSSNDEINVQRYLTPVKFDDSQPLAEAAFLQRVSSISGFVGRAKFETGFEQYKNFYPVGLGATKYHGDYVFGVNLEKYENATRRKANTSLGYDIQHSNHGLMLGYFVETNTVVYLTHSKSFTQFSAVGGESEKSDISSTRNKVSVRKLMQLSTGQYLAYSAGYESNSNSNSYSGAVRIYPTTSAYIEYGYTANNGKNTTSNSHSNTAAIGYGLSKQWDFHLGGEIYSTESAKMNTLRLGAQYKF